MTDQAVSTVDDMGDIRASDSAKDQAKAALRKRNKNEWTCRLTTIGCLEVHAGHTFNVSGWGVYDGKYIAEKVTHNIDGAGGGFTTVIEGHKVLRGY